MYLFTFLILSGSRGNHVRHHESHRQPRPAVMTSRSLHDIAATTRHLLLDFDGPVCSVFAGTDAGTSKPSSNLTRTLRLPTSARHRHCEGSGGQGRGRAAGLPLFRGPLYAALTRRDAAQRVMLSAYRAGSSAQS